MVITGSGADKTVQAFLVKAMPDRHAQGFQLNQMALAQKSSEEAAELTGSADVEERFLQRATNDRNGSKLISFRNGIHAQSWSEVSGNQQ